MPRFLTLDDVDVRGKTVLVRADLNVPMRDGTVTDTTRIDRFAPTARELAEKGAKVLILSHFGRPGGEVVEKYSLKHIMDALCDALGGPLGFCTLETAGDVLAGADAGSITVMENTRFHAGETANDTDLARQLADLGDIYVHDAFSCAHRAHASTEGVARLMPAVAGRLMQAELQALEQALGQPVRPAMAVVGGAKVSTKLQVLENLVTKVDALVLGGGMANTFLKAKGGKLGASLVEDSMLEDARRIMAAAEAAGCEILLPEDGVAASELSPNPTTSLVDTSSVPDGLSLFDVGPRAAAGLVSKVLEMKTVLWNGPLGVFEVSPFDTATTMVAEAVAEATQRDGLISVGGGGDTLSALAHAGVSEHFTYLSSAGGAFLEWLEGKTLPGVAALEQAAKATAE
ncbi:MAG: phosphoglycerate kinase [Alphaproteobacteria bacterium]